MHRTAVAPDMEDVLAKSGAAHAAVSRDDAADAPDADSWQAVAVAKSACARVSPF